MDWGIYFGWNTNAGLVCIAVGGWALHLLVQPEHWEFGHGYDYELSQFWGLGPLCLLTWLGN